MRMHRLLVVVPIFMLAIGKLLWASDITITVDQIETNEVIAGTVRGIEDPADYKVLVYVHTDQWYIHPFAGQGEGLSWAPIQQDGKWRIRTVQREFKADKVAALVVKQNYPEPNKAESLTAIPYKAINIKELRDTPDYGKL